LKNFQKIPLIMFGAEHNLSVNEQLFKVIAHSVPLFIPQAVNGIGQCGFENLVADSYHGDSQYNR